MSTKETLLIQTVTELKKVIIGEIISESKELEAYSHDASIFEVRPEVVVKPCDAGDIQKLVKFVAENKANQPELSLTARSGGTDMAGGPLNDSIILDFTAHFNKITEINESWAVTESGVYYRDLEKATLAKGLLLPSYPASREICTVGGMAANNAGGEKSLKYGKTEKYVEELSVILSDGEEYLLKSLSPQELEIKKNQNNFEGNVYKNIYELLESNYDKIQSARPQVHKNSAGYALWDIWDRKTFDLTKLFVGSQGTLGLITKIKLKLIKPAKFSCLLVIFLKNRDRLGDIIARVVKEGPESLESFDNYTLKLALRFMPEIIKKMKGNGLALAFRFIPELWMALTGGIPRLVMIAEFTGNDKNAIIQTAERLKAELLESFKIKSRVATDDADMQKYWIIRRESFNLLRKHVQGKRAAPFIDDIIVRPDRLTEFLPRLEELLAEYKELTYTIAGHAGDGNFHIIPLMDLGRESSRRIIKELSEKVYNLVIEFGGSITAEHNDGIIRTPYLEKMFGLEICNLFKKTKEIFDPQNIFNPGKKIGGTIEYAMNHITTIK